MKLLLVLVVLGIAVGGFFLLKPASEVGKEVASIYVLAVLEPNILVKQGNQAEFIEITKSRRVKAGDEIKTSSTGRASLLYPNGDITNIDRDSHLKIKTLEKSGDQSALTLLVGSVLAKVRHALGAGDYYRIETQNSVASVRGTIFAVKFKENKSSVLVLENKVLVSAVDPKTGEVIEDHGMVEVESGEKTEVKSDYLPSRDYPLEAKLLTKEDISEEFIEESLDQEDIKKEKVREIFEKIRELLPSARPSLRFKDFVSEEMEDEEKKDLEIKTEEKLEEPVLTPTVLPRLTVAPKPTATLSPAPLVPSQTLEPIRETIKETLTLTPVATPLSTPTPTPSPSPILIQTSLISITPKTIELSTEKQEIVLNGRKLTGTKKVFIGDLEAKFFVLDESTVFATVPAELKAGAHSVGIISAGGENLRLDNILTVR
ncbi:MAG: hypothetical protein A3I92_00065 [Candidatus Yanofskybacteria bacterium RIFCSPLOWO2_02_FULL_43_10b]|uniref:FecR protein domain-containing protein n=1 Tax=Candidatus Yanofskybacteria bacterium RIFCSPLOWO2_02_FULL_43_10b TaxID=1802704 RepID=A0A1F8H385_9BACT|nr:MAG: hypothetical protein A3I92_00065 [Candidatus Yanofskybacteria bacterium RIFCSPLOWO2_02_FULL_43_10b]